MYRKGIESAIAAAVALGGIFGLIVDAPDVFDLAVKVLTVPFAWLGQMSRDLGYWLLIVAGLASLAWIHFGKRIHSRWISFMLSGQSLISKAMGAPAQSDGSIEHPADERSQHDLNLFASDYVLPLCRAHIELQEEMISHRVSGYLVASLAKRAIMKSSTLRVFGKSYEYLNNAIAQSPAQTIPLEDLAKHILRMEQSYRTLFTQLNDLATKAETGIDYRSDERVAPHWRRVRERHNELVEAYWHIKRDLRFRPTLYRPGISGPWTEKILED